MNYQHLFTGAAMVGLAAVLSGCVVAPIGPRPVAVYPAGVYVEPAPVVVVPAPGYYRGGHRHHHRHWR